MSRVAIPTREEVTVEKRRPFRKADIAARYAEQGGRCALCPASIEGGFIADHRAPRALGGLTVLKNLDLICEPCNARKTNGKRGDIAIIAKCERVRIKSDPQLRKARIKRPLKSRGFSTTLRRRFDGTVERR
jgi:hypothetical protein